MFIKPLIAASTVLLGLSISHAQTSELNIYSARHYPTDEALYTDFTKSTGIKINRVDSDDAGILARLKAEGTASAADVILLVDAARLWRGESDGLFQGIRSTTLENAIPANLHSQPDEKGNIAWFGFSTRARVIVYDKVKVHKDDVDTYEELGDPQEQGQDVHPLRLAPVQPVAVRRRHRTHG